VGEQLPYKDKEKQREAQRRASRKYRLQRKQRQKIIEKLAKKYLGAHCVACGEKDLAKLHIHHADGDWSNNSEENLILLCEDCHRVIHWSPMSPYYDEEKYQKVSRGIEKWLGRKVRLVRKGGSVLPELIKKMSKTKERK